MLHMARYADTSQYTETECALWKQIIEQQGKTYYTAKGLPFTYEIKGNEILFSRKEKPVSRATVNHAYHRMVNEEITGSKQLAVFGASYLFPLLKGILANSDTFVKAARSDGHVVFLYNDENL